jgi:glycosyltransferase involved in cell wall biosynthesis
MIFTIYHSRAGFGLANDARILKNALSTLGHQVKIVECPTVSSNANRGLTALLIHLAKVVGILFFYRRIQRLIFGRPSEVAIHIEKVFYGKLFSHQKHILIPNQEWFSPGSFSLLEYIDVIWVKTDFAKAIFSEFKKNTAYIGFCSLIDYVGSSDKSRDYFFSRIGKGPFRGANKLVDIWRRHPEWPPLKMVIDPSCRPPEPPENVEYIDIFAHVEDYHRLAGGSLFHIYATEAEGFGHSINEAMGLGCVVLVTNAPPMNELVTRDCGLLIDAEYAGQKLFSPRFSIKDSALEDVIARAMQLDQNEIDLLSQNAKARFQKIKETFIDNLDLAIKKL